VIELSKISSLPKSIERILIVDDDVNILLLFESYLKEEGFYVESFINPKEAVNEFKPGFFDLALVDIRMPIMNGFEFSRIIKGIDKSIKICFLTGFDTYYLSLKQQFNLDIDCFIRKPVGKEELIDHVVAHLNDDTP
jgi:DNA-binding response OmpR family regulator